VAHADILRTLTSEQECYPGLLLSVLALHYTGRFFVTHQNIHGVQSLR
jgi:hypothetical protein